MPATQNAYRLAGLHNDYLNMNSLCSLHLCGNEWCISASVVSLNEDINISRTALRVTS